MKLNLNIFIGPDLRDAFVAPIDAKRFIQQEKARIKDVTEPLELMKLLGTLGVYSRLLGNLDEAEHFLMESIELVDKYDMERRYYVQQTIRLANVLHWKKDFARAEKMFENCISICKHDGSCDEFLDFAYQHLGKCYFDQEKWDDALIAFQDALHIRSVRGRTELIESSQFAVDAVKSKKRKIKFPWG